MNKTLSYIELTFENIDYIVIPAQYFTDICISNISSGSLGTAESIEFTLKKGVNEAAYAFTGDVYVMQSGGAFLFERISRYCDITHIKMIYEDDTFEEYTVVWEEDQTGCRNLLQKSYITDDGNLKVVIGK